MARLALSLSLGLTLSLGLALSQGKGMAVGAARMAQGSVSCYAQPMLHFKQFLMPKRGHPAPSSGSLQGEMLVQTATSLQDLSASLGC